MSKDIGEIKNFGSSKGSKASTVLHSGWSGGSPGSESSLIPPLAPRKICIATLYQVCLHLAPAKPDKGQLIPVEGKVLFGPLHVSWGFGPC